MASHTQAVFPIMTLTGVTWVFVHVSLLSCAFMFCIPFYVWLLYFIHKNV